jgi:hypothetical protein
VGPGGQNLADVGGLEATEAESALQGFKELLTSPAQLQGDYVGQLRGELGGARSGSRPQEGLGNRAERNEGALGACLDPDRAQGTAGADLVVLVLDRDLARCHQRVPLDFPTVIGDDDLVVDDRHLHLLAHPLARQ